MHIYHYHATYQTPMGITRIDGIIRWNSPVTSIEQYNEVKKFMIEQLKLPVSVSNLIVQNFSLLQKSWF